MMSDQDLAGIMPMRHAPARPVMTVGLVLALLAQSWGWERLNWCGFFQARCGGCCATGRCTRLRTMTLAEKE
jgi:hypothetical protein